MTRVCWCGGAVAFRADKGFIDCLADRAHDWRGKPAMTSLFCVTWPGQVASGQPCEEYATESAALRRAADLVALGKQHATVFEVSDEGEAA